MFFYMSRSAQASLRLAIFDFDGTLCGVNSYHVFVWWGIKRFRISSFLLLLGLMLRKLRVIGRPTLMRLALRIIRGKTRAKVEVIGRELYESALKPHLAKAGLMEIRAKRDEGCTVLILSGAFDFLLGPFCADQGIDLWRSTRLNYELDRCTGLLEGSEHLGEAKSVHVQEFFKGKDIDWQGSSVYSDELIDLPLFSLVGNKYFIVHDGKQPPELPSNFKLLRW
jgi:HAD superfamily hydrolase (TIGR01490 family)